VNRKSYSFDRRIAVLPIVTGVALAFYGDLSYTTIGAFYTILCVILAALKALMGSELLTGDLKLHEIDLLSKMCPLALVEIGLMSYMSGELTEISLRWKEIFSGAAPQVILLSGFLSFSLNVSSFIANKVTSPLTLAISANVKQVLLVAFGTLYFGDTVTFVNGLGIGLVIIGSYR
jgi:drug/metabolite transporter (DMT)-like permease